jgi:hypothetical protein
VLAYGRSALLKPDGSIYVHEHPDFPSGRVYMETLEKCWLISPGMALLRADTVRRLGGFDPEIWGADDWDLYIRLAREGEFLFEDRVCLFYRLHAGSASQRNVIRHANNFFKIVRKHSGWDVPLMTRQLRLGLPYFGSNLRELARWARSNGDYGMLVRAWAYRALFASSPVLVHLAHPRRILALVARVATCPIRHRLGSRQ